VADAAGAAGCVTLAGALAVRGRLAGSGGRRSREVPPANTTVTTITATTRPTTASATA
jgi:hypothetical protein